MSFLDDLTASTHKSLPRYGDALEYLHSRGIRDEDIEKYRIGYNRIVHVPNDGSEDRKRFMDESYGGKSFENTIIFPIQNAFGQVVGLIGRSIEEKRYKKFFSEEAKITGCFFGFFQALPSIYQTGTAVVTEGAFDCIPIAGVAPNTVGALTAGLSEIQYELLSFYCDKIVAIFDWDKEGQLQTIKAMRKWGAQLPKDRSPGRQAKIYSCRLGNYKDPSNCLQQLALPKFQEFVKSNLAIILQ